MVKIVIVKIVIVKIVIVIVKIVIMKIVIVIVKIVKILKMNLICIEVATGWSTDRDKLVGHRSLPNIFLVNKPTLLYYKKNCFYLKVFQ